MTNKNRSSSLHRREVSQHYVHCMNGVGADGLVQLQRFRHAAPSQHFVEHVPTDQRHKLDGNFKGSIFPALAWKSDIEVHLNKTKRAKEGLKVWLVINYCSKQQQEYRTFLNLCFCDFFQLTPVGATGSGLAVYKLLFPS